MIKENKKTPEIRFPGFTEDWEQRKLLDIYKDIGNAFVGTATPYYVEEGHFYLESNNIKDGQINHNTEVFINDEFYEKQKDKWLHTGDMVMVQSGHVGHAAVIPEELDCSAAHALIMFRKPKVEIEPYFLNYQYQTTKAKKKIENITTGNTIKHILASEMQEFVVDVTSYGEQKKIAGFFRDLDNLITLHQRKCDTLQTLKKSMLQKMFPKKGSSVPEIRFPSFTEDWEQRKVSEITSVAPFKPYLSDVEDGGEYEVIQQGDKPILGYANGKPFMEYEKTTLFGDHTLSLYKTKSPFFVASDGLKILYSEEMDGHFYYYLLEKYKPESEGYKRHFSILKECECAFPKSSNEQKKIGQYFDSLDNLITLHQRKCDTLKELKKGMLQKMFV